MTVLEKIKNLAHSLTPQQRADLAEYFAKTKSKQMQTKSVSLRGIWKGKFPDDLDVPVLIRDIRDEWKEELELYN
jgi:hypothetical protein